MRPLSLSELKSSYDRKNKRSVPKEGTKLHSIYNRLLQGEKLHYKELNPHKQYLELFYGFEFRSVTRGWYYLYLN